MKKESSSTAADRTLVIELQGLAGADVIPSRAFILKEGLSTDEGPTS